MTRIHYLQHAPFETPAHILHLCRTAGISVTSTLLWQTTAFPDPDDFDLLLIMGGPMNIYEHESFQWLIEEKKYIRTVIDSGKMVLGICLGSQLLADALGGTVVKNRYREIGWYPVQMTHAGMNSPLMSGVPASFTAFHWHGDTYPPPPGTIRLGMTDACDNQGFIYDNRVVGLQFHLEMTAESLEKIITACRDELIIDEYVQPAAEIRKLAAEYLDVSQKIMKRIFMNMTCPVDAMA